MLFRSKISEGGGDGGVSVGVIVGVVIGVIVIVGIVIFIIIYFIIRPLKRRLHGAERLLPFGAACEVLHGCRQLVP